MDRAPFLLPGAEPQFARDRAFDTRHVRIEVELDFDHKRVRGLCTTTFAPLLPGADLLELDAAALHIEAVTRDGQELAWSCSGERLTIRLPRPVPEGEEIAIAVRYWCEPRRGLYFIAPDEAYPDRPRQVWTQGQDQDSHHWFPCFDQPHEKATTEVLVTVPDDLATLSNGERVGQSHDAARKVRTDHWRHDVPHSLYLVTLVAGRFEELRHPSEDVEVVSLVPPGQAAAGKVAFDRTEEMMRVLGRWTGQPYPYKRYAQVVVSEFIFGGMENTTATTMYDGVLLDERARLDHDTESLVAHELAHQWFGDLLTCREWSHGWLNEGFATYAESLWKEHAHGIDERDRWMWNEAENYFQEDSQRYRRPIVQKTWKDPIEIFDRHLYEKGGWVLHMLRAELGDDLFRRALTAYVARHRFGSVETVDLARAVESVSGRNPDAFFEQWVNKGGHPELSAKYSWDEKAKLARVSVKQTQKVDESTPLFRFKLEARFTVDGERIPAVLEVVGAEQVFHVALPRAPQGAQLDPRNVLLKKLACEKPRELWLWELAHAEEGVGRATAAKALGRIGGPDAVAALKNAVASDSFWGAGAEAARALGEIKGEAALAALQDSLGVAHPRVRRAVVRALGEFRGPLKADRALASLVEQGDPSCFVEAEAARSLGKTRSPLAWEALNRALARPSYQEVIRVGALDGLAESRDARATAALLAWTRYGQPPYARRSAAANLGKVAEGRREAVDALTELLFDPDFRVRIGACEGLAEAADDRTAEALEKAAATDLDGRVRRRAGEAARDLRERRKQRDEVRSLRDELARVRDELKAVRDRVEKLEAKGKAG